MDTSTAELWLHVIAAAGFVLWVAGAVFVRRTAHRSSAHRHAQDPAGNCADTGGAPDREGSVQLSGDPLELTQRAAAELAAAPGLAPHLQPLIVDVQQDALAFVIEAPLSEQRIVRRGALAFASRGENRAEARWQLYFASNTWMLRLARIFVIAGLALLIGLYLTLRYSVLESPEPSVRAQTLQMVQCIHLLWPPFLFAGIERGRRRMIHVGISRFVRQLAFRAKG